MKEVVSSSSGNGKEIEYILSFLSFLPACYLPMEEVCGGVATLALGPPAVIPPPEDEDLEDRINEECSEN